MKKRQQQQQQQRPGSDDSRMSILKRMQESLRLGMRQHDGNARWSSSDSSVQNQALRAISEFVASLPAEASSNVRLKTWLDAAVIALTGLLQAEDERVQCKAADVTLALVSMLGSFGLMFGTQNLVGPLACLLPSRFPAMVSAAGALKIIIEKAKLSADDLLKTIKDYDAIQTLVLNLETVKHDFEVLVASAELLAVVLERLPAERIVVGCNASLRNILLEYSMSSNELLVCASLRVLSSLALCASVAAMIIQDIAVVLVIAEHCLKLSNGKIVLLHFLVCLLNFSKLLVLISEIDIRHIVNGCVATLKGSCFFQDTKWTAEEENLSLLAANMTSLLLSVRGKHRLQLIKAGLIQTMSLALLPRALEDTSTAKRNSRSQFQGYLWESLGWISYYCDSSEEAILFGQGSHFENLLDYLCATFFRVAFRWGERYTMGDNQVSFSFSTRGRVQICHATLLVVASHSERCSLHALRALEDHQETNTILTAMESSLHLVCNGNLKLSSNMLETRLYALAILCHLPSRKEDIQTLGAVTGIIKKQCQGTEPEWPAFRQANAIPSLKVFKPCCSEGYERSEDQDGVLFASVLALTSLLRNKLDVKSIPDYLMTDIRQLLLSLAREKERPKGIRWLAASGLSSSHLFGFPSSMGECLSKGLDDTYFSDVNFLFPDGSSLRAHRVVLAVRCPSLLPVFTSNNEEMLTVRISSRVTYRALKSLLEYIYTGMVQLEAEVIPEMKLLAKKCRLDLLLALLDKAYPTCEVNLSVYSLKAALSDLCYGFSDIVLRSAPSTDPETCTADHIHGHRVVLSSRSDYFEALFRSGMRDSSSLVIDVPEKKPVVLSFMEYLYADELEDPPTNCAWRTLNADQQWQHLECLIDLAGLADQWLHEELKKVCVQKVICRLQSSKPVSLCPRLMQHAAGKLQWEIVAAAADCMAPDYLQLRESGALECLEDEVEDTLRVCYVMSHLSDT